MADEPWDELMGPSASDLKKMLSADPPPAAPATSAASRYSTPPMAPPVRSSSGAPPPTAMFNTMPNRWTQYGEPAAAEQSAATARAVATAATKAALRESLSASGAALGGSAARRRSPLPIEDEESDEDVSDHANIRQEALKMLEVADDALSGSTYSVHRTISGGFQATAQPLGNKKRTPTALAGLSFTGNRKNLGRSMRDDPFASTSMVGGRYRDKKDGDDDFEEENIVDVIGMEQRAASSRPANEDTSGSNWSSRYSIDHTLLALSGGSVSNRKFLDTMDKEHQRERRSARNMFASSPHETQSPKVFGSGFSFRQKHVFGKQKATVAAPQPNLRTVWMDADGSMPLPSNRTKTWQEQLQQKHKQRRLYIIFSVVLFAFIATLASVLTPKNNGAGVANSKIVPGSVTFYVTSDVPYDASEEQTLSKDLTTLSTYDDPFLVHLGNIQESRVTLCQSSRYADVANMLQNSPLPVFVLPGEEDWSNCPNPESAWNTWYDTFKNFDLEFDKPFEVERHVDREENFAFVKQGVLFIGVHVVNGRIVDKIDQQARNAANFDWIFKRVTEYQDDVRAIVVFGNARPGHPQNQAFFDNTVSFLDVFGLPSVYVHSNPGNAGVEEYSPFANSKNVVAVQAQSGGLDPPLRINVGFGKRPFIVG